MPCPGCAREFDLADVLRGQTISCPDCGRHMRVEAPLDDEPILLEEDDDSEQGIREAPAEPTPPPFGIDAKRLKPGRFRKKKKRRSPAAGVVADQWAYLTGGFGPFLYLLLALLACWLLALLLTPLLPRLTLAMTYFGSALYMVGWLWIVLIAYRDDGWSGTMCLLTMLYAYVYAYLNVELTWKPAGLLVLGLLMQIVGTVAGLYYGVVTW